ncbi:MAG: hypothetical protein V7K80_23135, partial [Nostoc sp.]
SILTNGLVIFSKDNFYSSFLLSHVIYIKDESIGDIFCQCVSPSILEIVVDRPNLGQEKPLPRKLICVVRPVT